MPDSLANHEIGVGADDKIDPVTSDGLSYAMVVAHPDDDAYGAAGTVALHADDPGFRFILIHATDGGAGDIRPGFPATRESLGRVRMQEDEDAWRAVGRSPDRHAWLGLADGEVEKVPLDQLADAIGAILDEEQPTVVETFGARRNLRASRPHRRGGGHGRGIPAVGPQQWDELSQAPAQCAAADRCSNAGMLSDEPWD